ncbi:MAG: hypothetical protein UX17_C0011G0003 [Parcubacteria group bacterium GW2011_GWC2_45_7]|nr:MAG: hypothetical protein UX17_C0011G0003 [Parcubacteria group bacterium GW2011_GWC2_45_7]KKU73655.1 MAG: hypothetical protein UX98_C0005G0031 [Parcubacteria group bacterium GW2011_GWA2_47_26]
MQAGVQDDYYKNMPTPPQNPRYLESFLRESGYNVFNFQQGGDVRIFLAGLVQAALSLVGVIFFLMILYGGYLWLTAGGNEDQVKKGREFITRAVVGFMVTIGALIITRFVTELIVTSSWGTTR